MEHNNENTSLIENPEGIPPQQPKSESPDKSDKDNPKTSTINNMYNGISYRPESSVLWENPMTVETDLMYDLVVNVAKLNINKKKVYKCRV